MNPNFGRTAEDYGRHRAGFPSSFFDGLRDIGIGVPEQRIADLGTGTGTLARGFAERGCRVVGIDVAAPMLAEARRLGTEMDATVHYVASRAEATGLIGDRFDVVTAGQCWHWFQRSAAAREAARILTGNGSLVIGHFDWIPLAGNVVEATEKLIERHNPDWKLGGGNGVYPMWLRGLSEAGFRDIRTWSHDVSVPYTPEGWRGRIRASAGIGASLSADEVDAFDREHAAMLTDRFPGNAIHVHHRVFTLVAHSPLTV